MKINWGTGIAALYTGFVVMILVLVGMSASQKIDLVTDHYYEEELQFQNKINKTNRTDSLIEPLTWAVNSKGITIRYPENFPNESLTGKIKLYCPSNEKNDKDFSVSSSSHIQFIPANLVPTGSYHLQIDWEAAGKTYWNEGIIVISHSK